MRWKQKGKKTQVATVTHVRGRNLIGWENARALVRFDWMGEERFQNRKVCVDKQFAHIRNGFSCDEKCRSLIEDFWNFGLCSLMSSSSPLLLSQSQRWQPGESQSDRAFVPPVRSGISLMSFEEAAQGTSLVCFLCGSPSTRTGPWLRCDSKGATHKFLHCAVHKTWNLCLVRDAAAYALVDLDPAPPCSCLRSHPEPLSAHVNLVLYLRARTHHMLSQCVGTVAAAPRALVAYLLDSDTFGKAWPSGVLVHSTSVGLGEEPNLAFLEKHFLIHLDRVSVFVSRWRPTLTVSQQEALAREVGLVGPDEVTETPTHVEPFRHPYHPPRPVPTFNSAQLDELLALIPKTQKAGLIDLTED